MLKIENLQVHYGGIQALRGISLEVPDGKIVTLIGANGAGKSTTLRTITGLVKASGGSVQWDGQELLGKSIDKIISTGIAMSPEGRRVFPDMTVLENLKIGAYLPGQGGDCQGHPVGLQPVPPSGGAELAAGRHPFRRRAADAGRGPGADVPPQAAAAG